MVPSFYCESCGKEVPSKGKECPWCGKRFYSVRCPVCYFTGSASLFTKGCPSCGYLGDQGSRENQEKGKSENKRGKGFQLSRRVSVILLIFLLTSLVFLIKLYLSLL